MNNQEGKKRTQMRWGMVSVAICFIAMVGFVFPRQTNSVINLVNSWAYLGLPNISEEGFRLGLDLQGGAHLVYEADVKNIPNEDRATAVEGVRDAVERRVNTTGVSEPNVQTARVGDTYRLIVDLPGVENVNEAIKLIGETPVLEFKEENTTPPRALNDAELERIMQANQEAKEVSEEVVGRLSAGESFGDLAVEFSDDTTTKNNGGEMGAIGANLGVTDPLYEWAKSQGEGDVSEVPIETELGYHVVLRGKDGEPKEEVSASHILICYFGAQGCESETYTKETARTKAEELFNQANAENFAELAKEFSNGPSKDAGGDLGSFGRGMMIPSFEDAVFSAEVGQIIGPVETDFGYHVIYKTGAEEVPTYELAHIMKKKLTEQEVLPPQDSWQTTELSGKQLDRAEVAMDPQTGAVQVALVFDKEGKKLFEDITRRNLKKPVAIFLDGSPISIPVVQTVIGGGEAVITGSFTIPEAQLLSQRLNTGALPVPIELVSQQAIGASLGAESLVKSLRAGVIAIILVMVFMILYYRLPGVLSVISLSFYIVTALAIFKLIGVTLTLAGIAGFILSIGMAVDANVLIFERMKEELRQGKSLKVAVEEGFLRAWTSIRDGNLSTLITCVLLVGFGASFVKGFAATLSIGILLSMFSAITVTRLFLRSIVPLFSRYGNALFLGFTQKK